MMPAKKQRVWRYVEGATCACRRKQGIDVSIGLVRHAHDFRIDDFLARQACLREQPPDRGMEPEQCHDSLFDESQNPVFAANVYEFVTCDPALLFFMQ